MFEAVLPCPFVLGSELLYIPPLWDPWRSLAAGPAAAGGLYRRCSLTQ